MNTFNSFLISGAMVKASSVNNRQRYLYQNFWVAAFVCFYNFINRDRTFFHVYPNICNRNDTVMGNTFQNGTVCFRSNSLPSITKIFMVPTSLAYFYVRHQHNTSCNPFGWPVLSDIMYCASYRSFCITVTAFGRTYKRIVHQHEMGSP